MINNFLNLIFSLDPLKNFTVNTEKLQFKIKHWVKRTLLKHFFFLNFLSWEVEIFFPRLGYLISFFLSLVRSCLCVCVPILKCVMLFVSVDKKERKGQNKRKKRDSFYSVIMCCIALGEYWEIYARITHTLVSSHCNTHTHGQASTTLVLSQLVIVI